MLILRFVLGMQGGDRRELRWVPIRTQSSPRYFPTCGESLVCERGSGHVSIGNLIRSPLPYRRRVPRPVATGLGERHGPVGRLQPL